MGVELRTIEHEREVNLDEVGLLAVMGMGGDTKSIWDPDNEDEVEAAKKQFDELIEGGHAAFKVKKSGKPGKKITEFDPSAGKVILVPPVRGG